MLLEFDVHPHSRRCFATGRPLAPGELYFSTLALDGTTTVRRDYCPEAWQGPPDNALGWWKARLPKQSTGRRTYAPNEVLLNLFDQLAENAEEIAFRYVVGLLLIRRRVLRLEGTRVDDAGREAMQVGIPSRGDHVEMLVVDLDEAQMGELQRRAAGLLYADAA
ncbi:hypothetical protein OAS39_07425 [Pirellulales bacterium]|nr:hypothetical protein [Pirellulales bacterium]